MTETAAPREDADRDAAVETLLSASRLMTALVAQTLANVEDSVSVPQLRVLVMLQYEGPMNLTSIAEGLGVNPSNASRTCDKLAAAGLVERRDDQRDRRHLSISLTAKGRGLVDSLMDDRRALLDEIVGEMKPADQRRLARALDAFLGAADRSNGNLVGHGAILHWMR